MLGDLRHSVRALRRAPMVSLAAIATLAVAIGATTAVFSIIAISAGTGRLLAGLLYEVSPIDALTLVAGAVLIMVVGAAAFYMPARRAARLDPTVALRRP